MEDLAKINCSEGGLLTIEKRPMLDRTVGESYNLQKCGRIKVCLTRSLVMHNSYYPNIDGIHLQAYRSA